MNIKGFKTKDGDSIVQTGDMVDARVGNLAELTTADKTSVVAAINEAAASGGSEIFYNKFYVNLETMSITGADYTFAEMKAAIDEGKYVVLVMNGTNTHIPLYEYADNEMVFNQSCIQGSESGLFLQVEVSPSEDEGGDDTWSVYTATVSDTTSEIYHIEFDQGNSTITHDGEEINWLEFAQKIEAGVPIVMTGTVTPPGEDGSHKFQGVDYIVADEGEGVVIFPMMFWPVSGETAIFTQIIVNCTEQAAFCTFGTVGYTHQYPSFG